MSTAPIPRALATSLAAGADRAKLNPRVEGSYLTRGEIEQQLSDVVRFLVHLDDGCFSRTSRQSNLPEAVEFIKRLPKSDRKKEVIVCFGANFLDQLGQRFQDGDFETLMELVNVSLAQAENNFRSYVIDESEQALITEAVKTNFRFLASDVLGLDSV